MTKLELQVDALLVNIEPGHLGPTSEKRVLILPSPRQQLLLNPDASRLGRLVRLERHFDDHQPRFQIFLISLEAE